MDQKISVIIPMYKVEAYLRQCLDSVIHQTYECLEILLIDDGSPDRCGEICDEYAGRDSRIRVVHKINGGLSAAWNDGITMATGSWIAFVDSDDWLELDYFEQMLRCMGTARPDVLQAGKYIGDGKGEKEWFTLVPSPFFFENGEGGSYMMKRLLCHVPEKNGKESGKTARFVHVWDKLYRTEFLRAAGLRFDPLVRAGLPNDGLFNLEAFDRASAIMGCTYGGYHYRRTASSGTYRFDPTRVENAHYILERYRAYIEEHAPGADMQNAFHAYVIMHISFNLNNTFFHPKSEMSRHQIADGLRAMKQMRCYHEAIYSNVNAYLSPKQIVLKYTLRLPWIWPLELLMCFNNRGTRR